MGAKTKKSLQPATLSFSAVPSLHGPLPSLGFGLVSRAECRLSFRVSVQAGLALLVKVLSSRTPQAFEDEPSALLKSENNSP